MKTESGSGTVEEESESSIEFVRYKGSVIKKKDLAKIKKKEK